MWKITRSGKEKKKSAKIKKNVGGEQQKNNGFISRLSYDIRNMSLYGNPQMAAGN